MRKFLGFATYVAVICLAIPSIVLAQAAISVNPPEMESPAVGEQLTVDINIAGGANVAGYQVTVTFDPTALSYVSIENADYLPAGAFAVPPVVAADRVTLAATSLAGAANGDGTLARATFEVVEVKESTIGLVDVALSDPAANELETSTEDGTITVPGGGENQAPVAAIDAPSEASVGQTVSLSGAGSTDDGEITSYSWDFGDGSDAGEGETVEHVYADPGDYTVTLTVTDNGDPALTGDASMIITVTEGAQPVVTEPSGAFLWLQANILEANTTAHCFIPIWEGEMTVDAGTFLEYQVKFKESSAHKLGGVFVHTADSQTPTLPLPPPDSADWEHRKVSLDDLAGQTIIAITVGTDNGENPETPFGAFNMMVDNVQITDGTNIITAVWVDQDTVNGETELTDTFGDSVGANNCDLKVTEGEVAVQPKDKLVTTWGRLKAAK